MAGSYPFRETGRSNDQSAKFDELLRQQAEFLDYLKGDDIGGGVSGSPIQLGRKTIKDIKKAGKEYRTSELPDLFKRFQEDVASGYMTPRQASTAYESAARGAGQIEGTIQQARKLAKMQGGVPSAEKYQRYFAPMQLASEQLIGQPLSEGELKNYVAAFQGMGLSPENASDVMGTFGKMLTSSRKYRENEVIFRPDVVAQALPKQDKSASEAFQKLINQAVS